MDLNKSKSSTGERQRPDYNGARTRLQPGEEYELYGRREAAGRAWVVLADQRVIACDTEYTLALGAFYLNLRAGARVRLTTVSDHEDYMRRLAAAALVAL